MRDLSAFKNLHCILLHIHTFAVQIVRKPFSPKPITGRIDHRYLAQIDLFRNGQYPAAHHLPHQVELVKQAFQLDWFEINHFRLKSD